MVTQIVQTNVHTLQDLIIYKSLVEPHLFFLIHKLGSSLRNIKENKQSPMCRVLVSVYLFFYYIHKKINTEILCAPPPFHVHTCIQEAVKSKMNPRRGSASGPNAPKDDDDEIVIHSDTVRQRRSRTPSSNGDTNTTPGATVPPHLVPSGTAISNGSTLPDVLPDTFRLAETSALFSHVSDPVFRVPQAALPTANPTQQSHPHRVEIRESALSTTEHVSMMPTGPYLSANVNSISILESVDTFEPEFVEMVHIVDASEDDEIDEDTETPAAKEPATHSVKERDLLRDSEESTKKRRSLIPNLKEILCAPMGRDSFAEQDEDQQKVGRNSSVRSSRESDSSDMVGLLLCGIGRLYLM